MIKIGSRLEKLKTVDTKQTRKQTQKTHNNKYDIKH